MPDDVEIASPLVCVHLRAQLTSIRDSQLREDDTDPSSCHAFGWVELHGDVPRAEALGQQLRELELGALEVVHVHEMRRYPNETELSAVIVLLARHRI